MGLDMYLKASRYCGSFSNPELVKQVRILFPELRQTDSLSSVEVKFEVGYWRKANHIHKWFVDNVQNGKDDCEEYYVSKKDIENLLNVCKSVARNCKLVKGQVLSSYTISKGKQIPNLVDGKVIKNSSVAEELLPTTTGFFFGCGDYDEYYLEAVNKTIEICEYCLTLPESYSLYYQSSW
jgi:hypothetical protein